MTAVRRRVRRLAMLAAAAVVMAGCSSGGGATSSGATAVAPGSPVATGAALPVVTAIPMAAAPDADAADLVTALRRRFTETATATAVHLLAEAGITVVADTSSTAPLEPPATPASPVTLTRWQARNLALEVSDGGGVAGTDLDVFAPMPPGTPGFSYFLGAWVASAPSRAGVLARALMGDRDWRHADSIVYPQLALTLFTSDMAEIVAAGPGGPSTTTPSPAAAVVPAPLLAAARPASVVGTICDAVSGFVDATIARIAAALKIDTSDLGNDVPSSVGKFFAGLWNLAVDFAAAVVKGIIATLTAPIVAAIRLGVGVVGVVGAVVGLLKRWSVSDYLDSHGTLSFSHGSGAPVKVTMTLVVDTQGEAADWPGDLSKCASALGATLPPLSPTGSQVRWVLHGLDQVVVVDEPTSRSGTLKASVPGSYTSDLVFETGHETDIDYYSGDPGRTDGEIVGIVVRKQVSDLQKIIAQLFAHTVLPAGTPAVLQAEVAKLIEQVTRDAFTKLLELASDETVTQPITVTHAAHVVCKP